MHKILLTIAIPFYNGLDKISNILDNLYYRELIDYEILLINDCSSIDQTKGLIALIETKYSNGNLRYLYNSSNLGMDANFEKCIFESNGKYIWFFGQDDFVTRENLYYCFNLLNEFEPDLVFANYAVNRSWKYNSQYVFNSNLNLCHGVGVVDFLKISNRKLPSFLPSLIIQKTAWPGKDIISNFYGTYFIQLASFLYNLSLEKKWLYIGKPLAIGEIPSTGWQNIISERVKIYIGFVSCLNEISKLKLLNMDLLLNEQLKNTKVQHLLLSLECKIEKRFDLLGELINSDFFPNLNRLISKLVFYTPRPLLLFIQSQRSIYYKLRKN